MAFGRGKKRESWSSRPLSMILPENVKLFQRKGKSVMEKALQDQNKKSITGDATERSTPYYAIPDVSQKISSPISEPVALPIRNEMSSPIESPAEQPIESAKTATVTETAPEQCPVLTLNLGEATDSFLDLSDQYSNTGNDLVSQPPASQINSMSLENSTKYAHPDVSIDSTVSHNHDQDISDLTIDDETSDISLGSQQHQQHYSKMSSPHVHATEDISKDESFVGDVKTQSQYLESIQPTLASSRSVFDPHATAGDSVVDLSIGNSKESSQHSPEFGEESADVEPIELDAVQWIGSPQENIENSSSQVDLDKKEGPVSSSPVLPRELTQDIAPVLEPSARQDSTISAETNSSEELAPEQFVLESNRKVMINHGVYIFDPTSVRDLAQLRLSADESFNPFDYE